ncbi:Flavodoxin reductases (ferredoxin-NADPH reductases) family 1 [Arcticibacter svalbardensis MN12-7]|uniref:Flavodoxin reductases (Ferredoxin-NADPH reductases) family 1 n=1 Tax=Arcticibacter svalbardensis MN12-7 TaxID=1150600 RepID=R9H3G3_9SPHI|nr:MOSC N-terminal beta barrel domain-containing protein [Arcticibacter svalbardensis]EOR95704.1 Flavodoxin reductases (ferredoxin-NADPH reductases) family 1 [Arcticibacter svalbardensis MN12-7]
MLQITELFIYPIKSLSGISVNQAEVTSRGFKYDRRWMLVDEHNRFLTQREHPQMALIQVHITNTGLQVSHPLHGSLNIPFHNLDQNKLPVVIWDDTCDAEFVGDQQDAWFSTVLNTKCRLVYMPDDSKREVDQRYAKSGIITSFSDGYPFLLIGQASLDDLNSHLQQPLPIDRFRPNIVFQGGQPYEEDRMNAITIAGIQFYGVKLCARCTITTIDQQTGIKDKEPLKTLATYRLKNNKVLFGQNLTHEGSGHLTIGDQIKVLSIHDEDRFIV